MGDKVAASYSRNTFGDNYLFCFTAIIECVFVNCNYLRVNRYAACFALGTMVEKGKVIGVKQAVFALVVAVTGCYIDISKLIKIYKGF